MNIRKRTLLILPVLCAGLLLSACSKEIKENSTPNITTIPTGEDHNITAIPTPEDTVSPTSLPTLPAEAPTNAVTVPPTQLPTIVPAQEVKDGIDHSNTVLKEGSFL